MTFSCKALDLPKQRTFADTDNMSGDLDWPGRWNHIKRFLERDGPFAHPDFEPSPEVGFILSMSRVFSSNRPLDAISNLMILLCYFLKLNIINKLYVYNFSDVDDEVVE